MFKIPDWGDDVPKNNANFVKVTNGKPKKEKKVKETLTPPKQKQKKIQKTIKTNHVHIKKSNFVEKAKTFSPKENKLQHESSEKQTAKKKRKRKQNSTEKQEVPGKKIKNDVSEPDEGSILYKENAPKKKKKVNINVKPQILNSKKERIKQMLQMNSNRNPINVSSNLRDRMMERLKAAQFRYLNEKLYTSSGPEAQELFQSDPAAFHTYHEGYQQQLKKWPVNPLDVIVKKIVKMPKSLTLADMGCGEGALSTRVPQNVRSFDLVAANPKVEACDMAHTPLLTASTDVVVYCLALMGTDLTKYLVEANRVLKEGGHLLIAEVESRFEDVDAFVQEVQKLGFKLKNLDKSNTVFFFMEFTKVRDPPVKKAKLPSITLKPCLYKKR